MLRNIKLNLFGKREDWDPKEGQPLLAEYRGTAQLEALYLAGQHQLFAKQSDPHLEIERQLGLVLWQIYQQATLRFSRVEKKPGYTAYAAVAAELLDAKKTYLNWYREFSLVQDLPKMKSAKNPAPQVLEKLPESFLLFLGGKATASVSAGEGQKADHVAAGVPMQSGRQQRPSRLQILDDELKGTLASQSMSMSPKG